MADKQDQHRGASSRGRLAVALAVGLAGAAAMGLTGGWTFAGMVGWDVGSVVWIASTWSTVGRMDAEHTKRYAIREEPGRAMTDLLLVGASLASLVGVGFVIAAGGNTHGLKGGFLVALALLTVVISWGVVHTTFTLRYARLYYGGRNGGVEFNAPDGEEPDYSDFAYLAFTIGMTFQVSDTSITSRPIRKTVLRQALLSYLFGVVIISVMINLVASLTR
jgi:uncharacterized membrane protein